MHIYIYIYVYIFTYIYIGGWGLRATVKSFSFARRAVESSFASPSCGRAPRGSSFVPLCAALVLDLKIHSLLCPGPF